MVVHGDGGPLALSVDGLPHDSALDVLVDGRRALGVRTLAPPPGRELYRFASVGDVHVGDGWTFGILPKVRDPGGAEDPPVPRALRAALSELATWGAQRVVAKGDLTHHGQPAEWAGVAELLTAPGLPVVATRGNHDVRAEATDGRAIFSAAGIEFAAGGFVVHDLPGVRLIVADVTIVRRHPGSYRGIRDELLEAAAGASGPVVLAQHHQLQRLPFPTHWPPGVLGPESGRFLRARGL